MRLYLFFRIIFLSLLLSAVVQAKESESNVMDPDIVPVGQWYIGASLGWGAITNPLRGSDDILLYLIPDIRYYGERLSIENLDVSYALYESPDYVLELLGKQNMDGVLFPGKNRKVIAAFGGLPPISILQPGEVEIPLPDLYPVHKSLSYMVGIGMRSYGWLDSRIAFTRDISNVHGGYQIEISLLKGINWHDIKLDAEIGVTYKSKKLTQYYYNGDYLEEYFQPYNYRADAAINPYVKFSASYLLAKNFYLLASASNVWLDDTIHHSPIVVDNKLLTYFIGIKKLF